MVGVMKRSRDLIISQILDICTNGASKTRIVYQANLNFRTVNPYIELLMKNDLIKIKQGRTALYETTERGLNMLDNFKQIYSELCETKWGYVSFGRASVPLNIVTCNSSSEIQRIRTANLDLSNGLSVNQIHYLSFDI